MGISAHIPVRHYIVRATANAESAVKIAKNLVKKAKRENKDLQMALLEWRNTPDIDNLNPTQKVMSRRTRTTIPTAETLLKPEVVEVVHDNIKQKRPQTKATYDKSARPLPELQIGETVRGSSASKPQSSIGKRLVCGKSRPMFVPDGNR